MQLRLPASSRKDKNTLLSPPIKNTVSLTTPTVIEESKLEVRYYFVSKLFRTVSLNHIKNPILSLRSLSPLIKRTYDDTPCASLYDAYVLESLGAGDSFVRSCFYEVTLEKQQMPFDFKKIKIEDISNIYLTTEFAKDNSIPRVLSYSTHEKRAKAGDYFKNYFNKGFKNIEYKLHYSTLYTQGAVVVCFNKPLPSDISKHISSFVDRATGVKLAQTCRLFKQGAEKNTHAVIEKAKLKADQDYEEFISQLSKLSASP